MKPGFKPMLAGTLLAEDLPHLVFPLYGSPKFDGIRAMVLDGVLVSRNLKPIPNKHLQKLFGKPAYNGLDGELICGTPTAAACFRTTASAVMSYDGEPDVQLYVFDRFSNHHESFRQRMQKLSGAARLPGVRIVVQKDLNTAEDLTQYATQCVAAGYEGIMVRNGTSPYKFGRGTFSAKDLLKYKQFADAEAVVLGAVERMHNGNEATTDALGRTKRTSHKANKTGLDTLGALRVRGLNGPYKDVEFAVGTGWTDEERQALWNAHELAAGVVGQVLKYKYFPSGSKDAPRFPVFLVWRPEGA